MNKLGIGANTAAYIRNTAAYGFGVVGLGCLARRSFQNLDWYSVRANAVFFDKEDCLKSLDEIRKLSNVITANSCITTIMQDGITVKVSNLATHCEFYANEVYNNTQFMAGCAAVATIVTGLAAITLAGKLVANQLALCSKKKQEQTS